MFRAVILTACLTTTAAAEELTFSDVAGTYVVTSVRMASDVAQPLDEEAVDPTGLELTITPTGFDIPGEDCTGWTMEQTDNFFLPRTDPNLADVFIGSTGSTAYKVMCDGDYYTTLIPIDSRVLIVTMNNEGYWGVIEKSLVPADTDTIQNTLVDNGLLDNPSGELDAATHAALRQHFRDEFDDGTMAVPLRPAYTEAFLATLGVE